MGLEFILEVTGAIAIAICASAIGATIAAVLGFWLGRNYELRSARTISKASGEPYSRLWFGGCTPDIDVVDDLEDDKQNNQRGENEQADN